jgi:hypothetical protein
VRGRAFRLPFYCASNAAPGAAGKGDLVTAARCDAVHDVLKAAEQHVPAAVDDVEPGRRASGRAAITISSAGRPGPADGRTPCN